MANQVESLAGFYHDFSYNSKKLRKELNLNSTGCNPVNQIFPPQPATPTGLNVKPTRLKLDEKMVIGYAVGTA